MSGPALRKLESHHAIHETARHEADEALRLAQRAYASGDQEAFLRVAEVFLQVIEGRVLIHAAEEEQGLYQEWLQLATMQPSAIDELIQEHDAVRHEASLLERAMVQGDHAEAMSAMYQLMTDSARHSQHEEEVLRLLSWERSEG